MKKMILSLGLGFSLITNVYAQNDTLHLLNSEISNILAPFQNQNTKAQLLFNELDIDDEHVNQFAFKGFYKKVGSQNTLSLKIDNISYTYGTGEAPTTVVKGSLGFDFSKLLSQDELNMMVPRAMDFVQTIIDANLGSLRGAISLNGAITSTNQDDEGNYTAFSSLLSLKINLDKLPREIPRDSIQITDATVAFALNVKKGMALDAFVITNPEFHAFQEDSVGLKEAFEQIIAHDEAAVEELSSSIETLDDFATNIVEANSSPYFSFVRNFLSNNKK